MPASVNFGWIPNDPETQKFVQSLPPIYADQVGELIKDDENKDALLYRALVPGLIKHEQDRWLKTRGEWRVVRAYNQGSVGSCVGNATAAVLSVLNGVECVINKEPQEFAAMHSADGMYGLDREAAGMLGRSGDGCYGSAAAKAIQTLGTLYQLKYGDVDLTDNVPSRARDLGTKGVGTKLKSAAAEHKCSSATLIKSSSEAWALLGSGYPINVCSSQGFSTTRDKEGVCKPSGSWSHAMSVIGRRTAKDGRKLFLIWNSWGDHWASGTYWEDMPEGSFWIEWDVMNKMLARGDSFAYGGLEGFKRRNLDGLGSKEYLGFLKIKEDKMERTVATTLIGAAGVSLAVMSGNSVTKDHADTKAPTEDTFTASERELPPDMTNLDSKIIRGADKAETGFVGRKNLPEKLNRLTEDRFTP
ncbi:MAG: hypothetical protein LBT46_04835 [Planctomycetaceae bacterium]|nr:hypothetical protein [Planctomycetaceae bacterium]